MEHVRLGNSELKVSRIGIGTWQWGTVNWGWGKDYGERDVIGAFEKAIELGMNFFDTAEIYGNGRSEEILGRVIQGRREELVIATKVSPWHLTYNEVMKAARRSLTRLNTKYIDLYQVHFPNPLIPIESTMKALRKLMNDGLIRYAGVSNFSLSRLKRAQEALSDASLISDQVEYSIVRRKPESGLTEYAQKAGISIIAYSPLGKGVLSGKYDPKTRPRDLVRSSSFLFTPTNIRRLHPLIELVRKIAFNRGKTPSQVAINWLLRHDFVVPIPGVKSARQVEENANAVGWRLTDKELQAINECLSNIELDHLRSLFWIGVTSLRRLVQQ